jgi:hypothetical protein
MRNGWRTWAGCLVLVLTASNAMAQPAAITAHVGSAARKMSREDCALKAMHALIKNEKCVKAEIMPDGNVRGWTEKAAIAVVSGTYRDNTLFVVMVASHDNAESERLRNTVRQYVMEGDHDADTPRTFAAAEKDRKPLDLQVRWGFEGKPATKILRFLVPATSIVLEKQGLVAVDQSNVTGPLVFGGSPDRVAAAVAYPGPNELTLQFCVFGVSQNGDEADRLQRVVRQEVMKVLYD